MTYGGSMQTKEDVGRKIDEALNEQSHIKEAEENLHRLRQISNRLLEPELTMQIVEFAQRAILIVRKDGTIFYLNKLAEVIFEYPRQELWDQPITTIIPDRFRAHHQEAFSKYVLAPRVRDFNDPLCVTARKRGGDEVSLAIALLPVVIAAGLYVVASIEARVGKCNAGQGQG